MANIYDYLTWRGDIPFSQCPFNEIDATIFSLIEYVDLENIVASHPHKKSITIKDAFTKLFSATNPDDLHVGVIVPHEVVNVANECIKTPRYASIKVSNHINIIDNEKMVQFAAICFHIDENTMVVSYRGTDDTLIGWQENFNLIIDFPVPGEKMASDYLNEVAKIYPNKNIYVVGHSKGGNLAAYAAIYANSDVQDRIINSYDLDGPGFEFEADKEKYEHIKNKMIKVIPQYSVVGRLLNYKYYSKLIIVKSTNTGIYQHDALSWQLVGGHFITEKASNGCIKLEAGIQKLINKLSDEERIKLSNNIYNFILQTKKQTLTQCVDKKLDVMKATRGVKFKDTLVFSELLLLIFKNGGL